MYCGLDFGTSNCSIGHYEGQSESLVPLEGEETRLASVVWSGRQDVVIQEPSEAIIHRESEQQYLSTIQTESRERKKDGRDPLTAEERSNLRTLIEKQVRVNLKREAAMRAREAYDSQGIRSISSDTETIYGQQAIKQHALFPDEGLFFKSPKTFLGSELRHGFLDSFTNIVTNMLSHIKTTAEGHTEKHFSQVVLGRPVNWGLINTDKGNAQALKVMEKAAKSAGFKDIEFEYEPVAAAVHFEKQLSSESKVMIVDIGGGTTDVTMMILSRKYNHLADRKPHILSASGTRVGGNDLDIALAFLKICAHLGKESLDNDDKILNPYSPLNSLVYAHACEINDINSQRAFKNETGMIEDALRRCDGELNKKIARLLTMNKNNLCYRFNHSAELAKISLSRKEDITLPLQYLEEELAIPLSQKDLKQAIRNKSEQIKNVITEVEIQSGTEPDYIFFTGGSAKSPTLLNLLIDKENHGKVVSADEFSSVASGLTISAKNRFQ